MILVDSRAGSSELTHDLKALGLEVEETILPFGDVAFIGKSGENVGIEFKKLPDLVQSLRSGRLTGHQIPGMLGMYEECWLLLEGQYAVNTAGQVTVPYHGREKTHYKPLKGGMSAAELESRLLTIQVLGGFRVKWTTTRDASVRWIRSLYRWHCDKQMDQHQTLLQPHSTPTYVPLSDFRAVVSDRFPGIGLRSSLSVERRFRGSLRDACNASIDDWASIEVPTKGTKQGTKRIGIATAQRIVDFVRGK